MTFPLDRRGSSLLGSVSVALHPWPLGCTCARVVQCSRSFVPRAVPGAAGCGEKRCLIGRNRRLPQCWNPPHACTLPQFPSSPLLKFGRGPRSPPYALSWEESCPRSSGSTTFTLAPEPARHLPLFWAIAAECRTRFFDSANSQHSVLDRVALHRQLLSNS